MSRETVTTAAACVNIHATRMSDQTRPYRMQRRAELEEQTRTRIAASAAELHEELGVGATVTAWLAGSAAIGDSHQLRVAVVAIAGDPAPVEHDEVRWLGASELGEVDWLEPDRPFLAELVGHLSA